MGSVRRVREGAKQKTVSAGVFITGTRENARLCRRTTRLALCSSSPGIFAQVLKPDGRMSALQPTESLPRRSPRTSLNRHRSSTCKPLAHTRVMTPPFIHRLSNKWVERPPPSHRIPPPTAAPTHNPLPRSHRQKAPASTNVSGPTTAWPATLKHPRTKTRPRPTRITYDTTDLRSQLVVVHGHAPRG